MTQEEIERFPNGGIMRKYYVNDKGQWEGLHIRYYFSGNVWYKRNWFNGNKYGLSTWYKGSKINEYKYNL